MNHILPVFSSHYSLNGSLLTLEEPGKAKLGAPISVFDLTKEADLKEIVLVEERIDGFIEAYKNAAKAGCKLCFGIKYVICQDMNDRDDSSRQTESKIIVFVTGGTEGYRDQVRLWNRAWTTGHFTTRDGSYGRLDWKTLKEFWTPNLSLALPFFSSFLSRNVLTFNRIVPDLPDLSLSGAPLWVFSEQDSRLPFAPLIQGAIDRYVTQCRGTPGAHPIEVVPCKTILYRDSASFKPYVVRRAIATRGSWDAPEVDHLSSDQFSFEAWQALTAPAARPEGVVSPEQSPLSL